MKKHLLSPKEKLLLFKLYSIGMEQSALALIFDQTETNVYKIYLKFQKEGRKNDFSLAEKSKILTEFLLYNLTKSIHETTLEQKMKILPELLKIKEETVDNDANIAELYIPTKKESESQDQIPSELTEL
jgi:tRNA 2-selenouridine synthase SelU